MVSFLGFFNKGAVVEHGFVGLMPPGGHIEIFLILASDPCLVLKKKKENMGNGMCNRKACLCTRQEGRRKYFI